jgi:uncharacterized protein YkwD
MKRTILALLAVLTISALTFTGLVIYSSQAEKPVENAINTPTAPLNADTVFNLVNAEREKAGHKPLMRDARLDQSAQIKADDMANNYYFDHVNPITGVRGNSLIPQGMCSYKSENIILVDNIGEKNTDAIKWWMNSKPHHDAILDTQYNLAGMAVNGDIGVMHFCNLR